MTRPTEQREADRARLLGVLAASGPLKTSELCGRADYAQTYRDLVRLRDQGAVSSRRARDEDKVLFFCVECEEVLTSVNHDMHSGHLCARFNPWVLEWAAVQNGPAAP